MTINNSTASKLKVVYKDPKSLLPNPLNNELYSELDNDLHYAELKASILLFGILSPLITTKSGITRSGDLRRKIALELKIRSVPCIEEPEADELKELQEKLSLNDERMDNYRTILHDLHKKDTVYSKLIRKEILEDVYDLKQGKRTELKPDLAAAFKERNKIASKSGMTKLNNLRKDLEAKFKDDKKKQDEWLKSQGPKATLKTVCRDAKQQAANNTEDPDLAKRFDYIVNEINVYNQDCLDLSPIPDKSMQVVCGSPAYLNMRKSQGFENELGTQKSVEDYVELLVSYYKQCKRILTDDGCIWVNISDAIRSSRYLLSTEKFVIAMDKAGIPLRERIYWNKVNSQPGDGNGSMGNVELLLKFSFCKEPYTDYSWLNDIELKEDFKFGEGQRVRLSSFIHVRDGIVKTSTASTARLRKACKENGFHLEHTSVYPIEIPYLFLMTSCKNGSHFADFFNGTGTSGKAAIIINTEFDKNLVYHGFEINSLSVRSTKVNIEMDFGKQPSDKVIPFYPKQETEAA